MNTVLVPHHCPAVGSLNRVVAIAKRLRPCKSAANRNQEKRECKGIFNSSGVDHGINSLRNRLVYSDDLAGYLFPMVSAWSDTNGIVAALNGDVSSVPVAENDLSHSLHDQAI